MGALNLKSACFWDHHRSGWKYCLDSIQQLHSNSGVLFISSVEDLVREEIILNEDWVGFIHNVPKHPPHLGNIYLKHFDLEKLFKTNTWKEISVYCKGLFCLSDYLKIYLDSLNFKFPISMLTHPTDFNCPKFDSVLYDKNKTKRILMTGHWLRNFQAIYDLKVPQGYQKCFLKGGGVDYERVEANTIIKEDVLMVDRLTNSEYDDMFVDNIMFLPLYDSSANNALIEAIVRNTPVLISKLPATVEYLGANYPLFFESLEEASSKIKDSILLNGHNYLKNMNKDRFTGNYFLKSMKKSKVYRSVLRQRMFI